MTDNHIVRRTFRELNYIQPTMFPETPSCCTGDDHFGFRLSTLIMGCCAESSPPATAHRGARPGTILDTGAQQLGISQQPRRADPVDSVTWKSQNHYLDLYSIPEVDISGDCIQAFLLPSTAKKMVYVVGHVPKIINQLKSCKSKTPPRCSCWDMMIGKAKRRKGKLDYG